MPETQVVESKFKILSSGTHSSLGVGQEYEVKEEQPVIAAPAQNEEVKPTQEVSQTEAPVGELPKNEGTLSKRTSDTPTEETKSAKTVPAPDPTPKTWEDSLKEQGFDEKFISMAKVFKQKGNLKPYVEALSTDFSKMSPEQMMRFDLEKRYPTATQEQLELLFETDVKGQYKLDSEVYLPDTVEARAGRVKLEMDAQALRNKYTEEMSKLQLPSFDPAAEAAAQAEQIRQQQEANIQAFYNDEYVQATIKDKKIVISNLGKGVPDFNMRLEDPAEITAILTDPVAGARVITDSKGNLDRAAQMRIATFASNPEGFCQTLINYGKTLGREELIEEKHNPPKPQPAAAAIAKESLNEAFATRGVQGRRNG